MSMFVPRQVLDAIAAHRISEVVLVPTMINMLCDELEAHGGNVASLTNLTYGASAISETLLLRTMRLFPNAGLRQAYGQTELAPAATILLPQYHQRGPGGKSYLRSVGQPMVGIEIRIVDPDLRDVPACKVGEVAVRSPSIMMGYWNQPELTAETIVDGWLRTGDAGYLDEEGFLYLVDRVKDMIVSGGENVYSAEVENALASHARVRECAVIGVPDPRWGERVHAIIGLHPGEPLEAQDIVDHCRALIATYKCPRSVEFRNEPLPVSGAGKVLKAELRKPYWANTERNIA
jgi:long-chain acyl-CoA synthetase